MPAGQFRMPGCGRDFGERVLDFPDLSTFGASALCLALAMEVVVARSLLGALGVREVLVSTDFGRAVAVDVGPHEVGRLVPVPGRLLECSHQNGVDAARQPWVDGAGLHRCFGDLLVGDAERGVAGERWLAHQELVQQTTDRVQIAAVINGHTPGLLGGHVMR